LIGVPDKLADCFFTEGYEMIRLSLRRVLYAISKGARAEATSSSMALTAALLLTASAISSSANATVVTDPANDFIPSFTGAQSSDLDVLSAFGTYDGVNFHIGATLNGNIGTLATSLYVFGFNRGAANNNFAALGLPNVLFDAVITMTGAGVTGGRDLVANSPITLPAGAAHISGATFQIDFPASLLPSQGRIPDQYGINLWPRDASQIADAQIADFAPDNVDFIVSRTASVPEPASVLLVAIGLAGLAAFRRRRRY
jgi:hypothetical protein